MHINTYLWLTASLSLTALATPDSLKDCLKKDAVPFVVSGDPTWANETALFNLRYKYQPAAIAVPTDAAEVSKALTCAGQAGITVQAKSGGHGYSGFALGGKDGTFTISVEKFREFSWSPKGYDKSVVKVGAGLRVGDVAQSLSSGSGGAYGLPFGSVPSIGIGGHATHGGYGWASRKWGLVLDAIVALDVVLANGTVVTVSEKEYPDLFYAFRGAADSFGVVTNFYLRPQAAPKGSDLTTFSFSFANFWTKHTPEQSAALLFQLQQFATNAKLIDERLTFHVQFDAQNWTTRGLFFGSASEFKEKIQPQLLKGFPAPDGAAAAQSVDWAGQLKAYWGPLGVQQPVSTVPSLQLPAYTKSLLSPERSPLTQKAFQAYFELLQDKGTKVDFGWASAFHLYGGPGSAINKVSASASSYSHRDSLWLIQTYTYTTAKDQPFSEQLKWYPANLHDALTKASAGVQFGAYPNFVDDQLTPDEAHLYFYGKETYDKLANIKKSVDPKNIVTNPQGIIPAK